MSNLEVIRALEDTLAAAPGNLALRKHLAGLLAAEGLYAEAVQHYRRALDQAPADPEIKLALAEAYSGQAKDDVALVVLEDLMRAKTATPKALMLAARLYLEAGQKKEAERAYCQAVAADPGMADANLAAKPGLDVGAPAEAGSEPAGKEPAGNQPADGESAE